jgi:hypothetical protein
LLVTELNLTPLKDGKLQMALLERLPQRKRDMQINMDPTLTQGLLRLLHQAIIREAIWVLEIQKSKN